MTRKLKSYRELEVWQLGIELMQDLYVLTSGFPREERHGITSQLRQSALTVPSKIAEGYGRANRGNYIRFLSIAFSSACELEALLLVATKLGLLSRDELIEPWRKLQRIRKLLNRLMIAIRKKQSALPNSRPDTL